MKIGFIGLGNVGAKLAGRLQRNGFDLTLRDLEAERGRPFMDKGAAWADSPRELAESTDLIITCLPSPAVVSDVMESDEGVLAGLGPGKLWMEMSTTDEAEVRRLGALGSATVLKVVTNYLCSVHLAALGEALVTSKMAGIDLATAYEAIRVSSGNSFVHETESQVILNGSYNINFTMDLVVKDMSLFDALAKRLGVPTEISPLVLSIFREGMEAYGPRAWSSQIVKRLEDACGCELRAPGFPEELLDQEPEERGREVVVRHDG